MDEKIVKDSQGLAKDLVNDCISRKAAIEALHMHLMYRMGTDSNKKRLDDWINGVPSAQPERKKGRWLPDNRPGGGFWVCSECKFPSEAFAANVLYKFCPNCGADMREVDDERPD